MKDRNIILSGKNVDKSSFKVTKEHLGTYHVFIQTKKGTRIERYCNEYRSAMNILESYGVLR